MLSFSSDFWPLFWTVIGGGAAVTVVLSALVARLPRPARRRLPDLHQVVATTPVEYDSAPGRLPTAA